jgi:hypothetical protein
MSDPASKLEIKDILNILNKANADLDIAVKLPSVSEEIQVKPLNANHTKNIVKSMASGIFSDTAFNLIAFNIMNDVVKYPLDKLSILDKQLLLLHLRSSNISPTVEVDVYAETINENGEIEIISKKINKSIPDHIASLNVLAIENQTIDEPYNIVVGFPSISAEYQFEDHLYLNKLSKISEDNKTALKAAIAPIFIYNIAQYVKQITLGEHVIILEGKKIEERLAIVETLSAKAIKEIIQKIDNVFGKELQKITSIKEVIDGVEYVGSIKIGAELFIN